MTDRLTPAVLDAKLDDVNRLLASRGSNRRVTFYRAYGQTGIHKTDTTMRSRGSVLPTASSREAAHFLDGMRQALYLLDEGRGDE